MVLKEEWGKGKKMKKSSRQKLLWKKIQWYLKSHLIFSFNTFSCPKLEKVYYSKKSEADRSACFGINNHNSRNEHEANGFFGEPGKKSALFSKQPEK